MSTSAGSPPVVLRRTFGPELTRLRVVGPAEEARRRRIRSLSPARDPILEGRLLTLGILRRTSR
jgi:hypothetical protein